MKTLDAIREVWAAGGPLVTCDPGVQGTGLAYWRYGAFSRNGFPVFPELTGCIRGRRNLKGRDRVADVISRAGLWLANLPAAPAVFVVELPGLWEGNAVSHAAAVKGDTFGLAYLAGRLAGEVAACGLGLPSRHAPDIWTVSPQEWKGQLPKATVDRRIVAAWAKYAPGCVMPPEFLQDHVSDAVGMGLSIGGWL